MFAHSPLKAAKANVSRHTIPKYVASGLKPVAKANFLHRLPLAAHMSTSSTHRQATPTELPRSAHTPSTNPIMPQSPKQFADYDMTGKVYVVTGGAQGLGLSLAESLAGAGGKG
jgi:hypothetical protein